MSRTYCNGYKGSDISSYDPITQQLTPLYNRQRAAELGVGNAVKVIESLL